MKRKKKTKQNTEYWKSGQATSQDNEDFEDKHDDQKEESEQDADKREARTWTFKSPKPILELETWVL